MMELINLTSISPIDGRYRSKVSDLDKYFSEFALIKYRVLVELEYFIQLCETPLPQLKNIDKKLFVELRKIYENFTLEDAQKVKDIENVTNHDVKAVEYFLREKFEMLKLSKYNEFIHFGLTSQDINNTATPLLLKDAMLLEYFPLLAELINDLTVLVESWKNIPMLARTHGQPASPTKLGKEIDVFVERVKVQVEQVKTIPFSAKFGGATGNFNAHFVAYPEINWMKFGDDFVNNCLGLDRSQTTTQIEHYDNLAALFDAMKRINTILIDLDRDFWTYISMGYFKQKIKKNEVGSSAMPHKVNPIDFENSEGNLGLANAIFEHLSAKLPISRLQRDLTDSTVSRNIGVPFAHTILAIKSLQKGLSKLVLSEETIRKDLEDNWSVVAEAIQTILRREGFENPYDELKKMTRTNKIITQEAIQSFIETLNVSQEVKKELHNISPFNYTGIN